MLKKIIKIVNIKCLDLLFIKKNIIESNRIDEIKFILSPVIKIATIKPDNKKKERKLLK